MKAVRGIFWKILFPFLIFTALLSLVFAAYIFINMDRLGDYLLLQQVRPVMNALIELDRYEQAGDKAEKITGILATAVNGHFFAGKEIPEHWLESGDGLHIHKRRFFYLTRRDGMAYALSGSASPLRKFLAAIGKGLIITSCIGLGFAGFTAWLLTRWISGRLIALTKAVEASAGHEIAVPAELAATKDETGILAAAIIRQQKEAKDAWERETAFTGDVSHELRTPLAILEGSIEVLSIKNLPEDTQPILARMTRTTGRMADILHALLVLARKTSPPAERLDLLALLMAELENSDNGGDDQISFQHLGTPLLKGQKELAATILRNLLLNAQRYKDPSSPIYVELRKDYLQIKNKTGIREQASGSGLGLSIACRACKKMDWMLKFEIDGDWAVAQISWNDCSGAISA